MKSEKEAKNKRNINNMTQVDYYKSPWKDKYATTVNDSAYKILNSWNDDESDLSKHVETIKEPIKDTHVHDTSVGATMWTQLSPESESLNEGDLGLLVGEASPKS